MPGRLYFWEDKVLYLGPGLAADTHAHHAVQVCIPLSGRVRLRSSPRTPWHAYDGAVIPSDVPHESDTPVALLATFWLDAETPEARWLVGPRVARAILSIGPPQLRVLAPRLLACWEDRYDEQRAASLLNDVIRILAPCAEPRVPLDPGSHALANCSTRRRCAAWHSRTSRQRSRCLRAASPISSGLTSGCRSAATCCGCACATRWGRWPGAGRSPRPPTPPALLMRPISNRTFRRMLGFTPSAALGISQFVQDGLSTAE
jgi:hypothetical protein